MVLHGWSLRAELLPVAYSNDSSFQQAYLRWATDRLGHGRTPFDGIFPDLGAGFPVFRHYQVAPHLLMAIPAQLFGADVVYRWSTFLLLVAWPLAVWWCARSLGATRWAAAIAGAASVLTSNLAAYGFERGSFVWRGHGMYTLLWGTVLMPIVLGAWWRFLRGRGGFFLPTFSMALLLTSHLLTGYLTLLVVGAVGLIEVVKQRRQGIRAMGGTALRTVALVGAAAVASLWLLYPAWSDQEWTRNSLPNGTPWTDSHGARKVFGWLVRGELFDNTRWPVLTVAAALGLLVLIVGWLSRGRWSPRLKGAPVVIALLVVSLVLFCGRPTFGWLINLLPGNSELFLHRMVVGVHLAGSLLVGVGLAGLGSVLRRVARRLPRAQWVPVRARRPILGVLAVAAAVSALFPAAKWAWDFDTEGRIWSNEQRSIDRTDTADFDLLAGIAFRRGTVRLASGPLPNTAPGYHQVGYVPGPIALLNADVPGAGFSGRVPSLSEPTESLFSPLIARQDALLGVDHVIVPNDGTVPTGAKLEASAGAYRLFKVGDTSALRVMDTGLVIVTSVQDLPSAMLPVLASEDVQHGRVPLLALNGRAPGTPSLLWNSPAMGVAGDVSDSANRLSDGEMRGHVVMNRRAYVVTPVSFHPRWNATIDGHAAEIRIVAPGFMAVEVPQGNHAVVFHYETASGWLSLAEVLAGVGLIVLLSRRFRVQPGHGNHVKAIPTPMELPLPHDRR